MSTRTRSKGSRLSWCPVTARLRGPVQSLRVTRNLAKGCASLCWGSRPPSAPRAAPLTSTALHSLQGARSVSTGCAAASGVPSEARAAPLCDGGSTLPVPEATAAEVIVAIASVRQRRCDDRLRTQSIWDAGSYRRVAARDRDIACAERQTIDEFAECRSRAQTTSSLRRGIEPRDVVVPFWCRDVLTRGVREPTARHHALQRRRSEHMQRSR
jgi:hypothetical protein